MTSRRLLTWLRALLRPAPLLGMAMIAMFWIGLLYLLADHHGALAQPAQRRAIYLPVVVALTLLELGAMIASIRRQLSLEQTNLRFNTALENMTHGLCMFDGAKRLVICNERYASLYRLPPELLKVGHHARSDYRASRHERPAQGRADRRSRSTRSSARWASIPPRKSPAGSTSLPTAL